MTAPIQMPVPASPRDAGLTRRSFAVGAALTLASLGAAVAQPRRAEHRLARQRLADLIPTTVGPWRFTSADGVVVAREDGPVDGYDQVVSRKYRAAGLPEVMVLLAYGSTQGGSLQLHRPETCYPGQGFTLSDFSPIDLQPAPGLAVPAHRFTARRDDRIERLMYWTRIANDFPGSTAGEYRAILGSLFTGVVPDGILVRLSSIGADTDAADQALLRFFSELIATARSARPILIGNAMAAATSRADATRNR